MEKTNRNRRAFSLVEVVVALAVAAFALVIIVALIPVGLESANDAVSDTRTSMIAQDVALRLRTIPGNTQSSPPVAGQPLNGLTNAWYYDINGAYLGTVFTNAFYRVDSIRNPLNNYPANTNPNAQDANNAYSTQLQAAVVNVGWPVNTSTGTLPTGKASTNTYTFYVRTIPNA